VHRHFFFIPLFSGCLLNFSAFDHGAFIEDYGANICTLYVDCLDDVADGNTEYGNSLSPSSMATCIDWVNTSKELGCTPNEERARQCYQELEALQSDVTTCGVLWSEEALPSCGMTYLNCITDRPLGTLPPKTTMEEPGFTDFTPAHGPDTGNTLVTIQGSRFDSGTSVYFGDLAGDILSVTSDRIEVYSPPSIAEPVNVTVRNQFGTAEHPQSYRYWEADTKGTGIYGWVTSVESVGEYWEHDLRQTLGGVMFMSDSDPEVINYRVLLDIAATTNNCVTRDGRPPGLDTSIINAQYPNLRLTSPNGTLALDYDGPGVFDYSSDSIDIDTGTAYSLEAEGINGWPALNIMDVLNQPIPIVPKIPEIAGKELFKISSKPSFILGWEPEYSSYVIVRMGASFDFDSTFIECVSPDKPTGGSYTMFNIEREMISKAIDIPGILGIEMCRVNEMTMTEPSPINNGRIDTSTVYCTRAAVQFTD